MASAKTATASDRPTGLDGVVGHDAARRWLRQRLGGDRLPHALLVVGPRGVGKRTLACALAQEYFCAEQRGCGTCAACQAFEHGNAAGFVVVETLEGRSSVTIGQIKELQREISRAAPGVRGRLSLLRDAERLTPPAQDALLKTLEEPPPGNLLVLTSARPDALFPTIRSRCQRLALTPLGEADMTLVRDRLGADPSLPLGVALGCPGRLLELARQDVARLRQGLVRLLAAERGPDDLARITVLLREGLPKSADTAVLRDRAALLLRLGAALVRDLVLLSTATNTDRIRNPDLLTELQPLASRPDWSRPGAWLDRLARCRDRIQGNTDPALALYGLLHPRAEEHLILQGWR